MTRLEKKIANINELIRIAVTIQIQARQRFQLAQADLDAADSDLKSLYAEYDRLTKGQAGETQ